jgi:uncharacterized protein YndB with AHSA1/START domain
MSIHQEAVIEAAPQRVYEALTNGDTFAAVTGKRARLSDREGDAFSLFDGRVQGRQIELVPGERVVQAWRFGTEHPSSWEPGIYSVVRFTLAPEGSGTRFVIDHDGIPPEWHDHISTNYPSFYQEPLKRYFSA